MHHNHPPQWIGTALRLTAVSLLFITILLTFLINRGTFDPQPIGTRQWQKTLRNQTIPPQAQKIIWLQELPPPPYSLRLTAVYQSGATDIAYGLIIGDDTNHLALLLSPLGYLTIEHNTIILLWQPWPHVRTLTTPNEIWVDVTPSQTTIRINRELLWQGKVPPFPNQVGIMLQSFGQTAVVHFQTLEHYAQTE